MPLAKNLMSYGEKPLALLVIDIQRNVTALSILRSVHA